MPWDDALGCLGVSRIALALLPALPEKEFTEDKDSERADRDSAGEGFSRKATCRKPGAGETGEAGCPVHDMESASQLAGGV